MTTTKVQPAVAALVAGAEILLVQEVLVHLDKVMQVPTEVVHTEAAAEAELAEQHRLLKATLPAELGSILQLLVLLLVVLAVVVAALETMQVKGLLLMAAVLERNIGMLVLRQEQLILAAAVEAVVIVTETALLLTAVMVALVP